MSATLTACKFSDPAYNGGAVTDGWITSDGYLIEPGNTNGNFTDPWGWYLAKFQAGELALDADTAAQVRGECAATGITPLSTWEYIGKPLAIMAAAVAGGEFLGAAGTAGATGGAGAASGAGTLAPTVIAAPADVVAAAPVSLTGLAPVAASLTPIGAVGGVGAGSGLLGSLGSVVTDAGKSLGLDVVKTGLLSTLPKPKLPALTPMDSAPAKSSGAMLWLILGAAALALGGVF